jgi:hypothetical protein
MRRSKRNTTANFANRERGELLLSSGSLTKFHDTVRQMFLAVSNNQCQHQPVFYLAMLTKRYSDEECMAVQITEMKCNF